MDKNYFKSLLKVIYEDDFEKEMDKIYEKGYRVHIENYNSSDIIPNKRPKEFTFENITNKNWVINFICKYCINDEKEKIFKKINKE